MVFAHNVPSLCDETLNFRLVWATLPIKLSRGFINPEVPMLNKAPPSNPSFAGVRRNTFFKHLFFQPHKRVSFQEHPFKDPHLPLLRGWVKALKGGWALPITSTKSRWPNEKEYDFFLLNMGVWAKPISSQTNLSFWYTQNNIKSKFQTAVLLYHKLNNHINLLHFYLTRNQLKFLNNYFINLKQNNRLHLIPFLNRQIDRFLYFLLRIEYINLLEPVINDPLKRVAPIWAHIYIPPPALGGGLILSPGLINPRKAGVRLASQCRKNGCISFEEMVLLSISSGFMAPMPLPFQEPQVSKGPSIKGLLKALISKRGSIRALISKCLAFQKALGFRAEPLIWRATQPPGGLVRVPSLKDPRGTLGFINTPYYSKSYIYLDIYSFSYKTNIGGTLNSLNRFLFKKLFDWSKKQHNNNSNSWVRNKYWLFLYVPRKRGAPIKKNIHSRSSYTTPVSQLKLYTPSVTPLKGGSRLNLKGWPSRFMGKAHKPVKSLKFGPNNIYYFCLKKLFTITKQTRTLNFHTKMSKPLDNVIRIHETRSFRKFLNGSTPVYGGLAHKEGDNLFANFSKIKILLKATPDLPAISRAPMPLKETIEPLGFPPRKRGGIWRVPFFSLTVNGGFLIWRVPFLYLPVNGRFVRALRGTHLTRHINPKGLALSSFYYRANPPRDCLKRAWGGAWGSNLFQEGIERTLFKMSKPITSIKALILKSALNTPLPHFQKGCGALEMGWRTNALKVPGRWAGIYNFQQKNFIGFGNKATRGHPYLKVPLKKEGHTMKLNLRKTLTNPLLLLKKRGVNKGIGGVYLKAPREIGGVKFKVEKVRPLKPKRSLLKTWYLEKYKKKTFYLKKHSNNPIVLNFNGLHHRKRGVVDCLTYDINFKFIPAYLIKFSYSYKCRLITQNPLFNVFAGAKGGGPNKRQNSLSTLLIRLFYNSQALFNLIIKRKTGIYGSALLKKRDKASGVDNPSIDVKPLHYNCQTSFFIQTKKTSFFNFNFKKTHFYFKHHLTPKGVNDHFYFTEILTTNPSNKSFFLYNYLDIL